jgi:tol-pal system protein YbgF
MVLMDPRQTRTTMPRFAPSALNASALALVAFVAFMAAYPLTAAQAQEAERPFGLLDRIFGGSERMSGGPGERVTGPVSPDRTAQAHSPDIGIRLDRLEAQIRQLTGVIEQLQHRNQQLEGHVRRMQEDNEHRSQEPGPKGAPRSSSQPRSGAPQSIPSTVAPSRRGDAFDPSQNPDAPGAPQTLGSIASGSGSPLAGRDMSEAPVGAPGGRGAGAPLDLATMSPPGGPSSTPPPRYPGSGPVHAATQPPTQTPRDEFDLAYGYLLRKDYALAEDGFRSFLSKYPGDRLAGEANFWFGETLFQRQRFRDAAEAFLDVSTKHESAAKAPDALLRLGQSLAALGEKEAACASLGEVLRKYPRASVGVKQGVEREQKRVRC